MSDTSMLVGLARITLALGQSRSLKDKRSVVRKVVDRARARFSVSIAEVGAHDVWQQAVVGLAVVGSDGATVRTQVDEVIRDIEALYVAPVLSVDVRLVAFDDFEPGLPDVAKNGPNALTRELLAGDPGPDDEVEDAPWATPDDRRK